MNFDALKQNMEKVFEAIKASADDGALPGLEAVNQFVRLTSLMQLRAEEPWTGEAEDFAHLAQQLLTVVKKNLLEDAILLVQSLDDARAYCHRMFKE